jgi:hypothetical protein
MAARMSQQEKRTFAEKPQRQADESRTVPADSFMATIAANVDNKKMNDKEFRQFIRNTLPIVIY